MTLVWWEYIFLILKILILIVIYMICLTYYKYEQKYWLYINWQSPPWCITIRVLSDFVLYWIKQSTLGTCLQPPKRDDGEIDTWNWHVKLKLTREIENVVLDFDYFNPIRQSANRSFLWIYYTPISPFNLCFSKFNLYLPR